MTRWFAAGHYARATVCAVNGTNAKRSAAAPGSSPAAAQRGAEGAGLDPGAARRSTIEGAVKRAISTAANQFHLSADPRPSLATARIYTSLTDVTTLLRDLDLTYPNSSL
jgi:hypothetical protein